MKELFEYLIKHGVTEKLLEERQRVLDAIPECPVHGKCVPHALEWIEKAKASLSAPQDEGWVKESELDEMTKQKDYWYNRCYQAEFFIEKSPCDPDITSEQIEAHNLWQESKKNLPTI